MEQELIKERKPEKTFKSGRFRFYVYLVAIACALLCTVVILISLYSLVSLEKRLASVESKLDSISEEFSPPENEVKEVTNVRYKRSASQHSMPDLYKRLVALETRTVNFSEELRKKTSFRGRDGRDGMPGPPGPAGRDGRDGREGPPGPRGLMGPKGDVGRTGITGPQGQQGPQGPRGPEGQGLSGVSYNRWGRTNCSGDATVVYTGFMGGDHYTHKGGGTSFLCLTKNPIYDKYLDGWQGTGSIYGTEYESSSFPGFKNNLHQHDAPCAVCYVRSRGSQMMIPATNKCPSGWTKEYHGYLMTSHYSHAHSSEYVCVDVDAEVIPGSQSNTDGALLYMVQGSCGALPCKPYIHGHELTCVVCTK